MQIPLKLDGYGIGERVGVEKNPERPSSGNEVKKVLTAWTVF
jgi:hypothetical protein